MLEAELELARDCYRRQAWSDAHELLSLADRVPVVQSFAVDIPIDDHGLGVVEQDMLAVKLA